MKTMIVLILGMLSLSACAGLRYHPRIIEWQIRQVNRDTFIITVKNGKNIPVDDAKKTLLRAGSNIALEQDYDYMDFVEMDEVFTQTAIFQFAKTPAGEAAKKSLEHSAQRDENNIVQAVKFYKCGSPEGTPREACLNQVPTSARHAKTVAQQISWQETLGI